MKTYQLQVFKFYILFALCLWITTACDKEELPVKEEPTLPWTTINFNPDVSYGSMTDQDGNTYKTVIIGNQEWMAENLRTTSYNDGTPIQNITFNWARASNGDLRTDSAYCVYNFSANQDTIAVYGLLYNWYAVNTGKLAPHGWHVPSYDEWKTLIDYLGGYSTAAPKLQESGKSHWLDTRNNASNETGFTALPCGMVRDRFEQIGECAYWWSSTKLTNADNAAWYFNLYGQLMYIHKELGFSVRCLRD